MTEPDSPADLTQVLASLTKELEEARAHREALERERTPQAVRLSFGEGMKLGISFSFGLFLCWLILYLLIEGTGCSELYRPF